MGLVCLCAKPNALFICMLHIYAVCNINMDNKKVVGSEKN